MNRSRKAQLKTGWLKLAAKPVVKVGSKEGGANIYNPSDTQESDGGALHLFL